MRTTFLTSKTQMLQRYSLEEILAIPFRRFQEISTEDLLLRLQANESVNKLSEALYQLENISCAEIESLVMQNWAVEDSICKFLAQLPFLVNSSSAGAIIQFVQKLAYKRAIKCLNLGSQAFVDALAPYFHKHFSLCAPVLGQVLHSREKLQKYFLSKHSDFLLRLAANSKDYVLAEASFQVAATLFGDKLFEMQLVQHAVECIARNASSLPCSNALYALSIASQLCSVNCNQLPELLAILYAQYGSLALRCFRTLTRYEKTQFCLNGFVQCLLEITLEDREDGEMAAEILQNVSESPLSAQLLHLNSDILLNRGRRTQSILLQVLDNLYMNGGFQPDIDDCRQLILLIGQMSRVRYFLGASSAFSLLRSIAFRDGLEILSEFGVEEQAEMCEAAFGDGEWTSFACME